MGIIGSDLLEFLLRLFIPEGMEQSDAALEGLLHQWHTGDWKDNGAELSGGQIFVVMMIFVVVGNGTGFRRSETWGSGKSDERREDQQTDDAFHGNPAEKGV